MIAVRMNVFRETVKKYSKGVITGVNAAEAWFLPIQLELLYDAFDVRDCDAGKDRVYAAVCRCVEANMDNPRYEVNQ